MQLVPATSLPQHRGQLSQPPNQSPNQKHLAPQGLVSSSGPQGGPPQLGGATLTPLRGPPPPPGQQQQQQQQQLPLGSSQLLQLTAAQVCCFV